MNSLTSIIFKNDIRRDITANDGFKGKIFNVLSFLIVFGALSGFMVWTSISITKKLQEVNQDYAFIDIMLLGNFLILFIESIFQILNKLYFSKDLKILLRMPIKSKNIINSKLLRLITSEYQMELIMLAIPMIVYGFMHNVGIVFYLYTAINLIILPVIPISINTCIVAVIMRFTNLIKNKSMVMYIAIILSIIILNFLFSIMNVSISELFSDEVLFTENGISNEISKQFKLINPIINSLQQYNSLEGFKYLIIFFIESVLIYSVVIIMISPIYLKGAIGTVINGNKSRKEKVDLKIEDFKEKSYKKAYISKEYKVIKRSPIFFIQCIIMPVVTSISILVVFLIFLIATKNIGIDIFEQIRNISNTSLMACGFISVTQIIYMLSFSSIIAISKEEKSSIISKYIPIKLSEQLKLKLYIGEIINFISSIIITGLYFAFTENSLNSIFILIISIVLNTIGEKIKIFIDLRNPRMNWDSEYEMMKQNTNMMYELFYTMIIIIGTIFAGIIISNIKIFFITLIIILLISNAKLNSFISKNEDRIFEKLY